MSQQGDIYYRSESRQHQVHPREAERATHASIGSYFLRVPKIRILVLQESS
jgi:hypothetical protein